MATSFLVIILYPAQDAAESSIHSMAASMENVPPLSHSNRMTTPVKAIKIAHQLMRLIFSLYTLAAMMAVMIGDVATRRLQVAEGKVCKPIFIATV